MALSKADILAANDLPRRAVSVPEWGGDVYVRTMTGAERDEYETLVFTRQQAGGGMVKDLRGVKSLLVVLTTVDDAGVRLFDKGDAEALSQKSAAAINRIADVALELAGYTAKDVEELAKNS